MSTAGSDWREVDYFPAGKEQKALQKDFAFKNFVDALAFVNKIGELAEKMSHHPDLNLGWGYVRVWTTSHDAHAITDKDYELARAIDEIA